jgi:hypothetical protein
LKRPPLLARLYIHLYMTGSLDIVGEMPIGRTHLAAIDGTVIALSPRFLNANWLIAWIFAGMRLVCYKIIISQKKTARGRSRIDWRHEK